MNRRPESFVEVLQATADWLDTADKAIGALCKLRGVDNPSGGDQVQRDLRALAHEIECDPQAASMLNAAWDRV